jgi:hypothetical protein
MIRSPGCLWTVGQTISHFVISDPAADWRTPQRAGSAMYRSLWEALRYFYRKSGLSVEQMKQLSFCLRREIMDKAREDLIALKNGEVVQPQRPYAEVSTPGPPTTRKAGVPSLSGIWRRAVSKREYCLVPSAADAR